MLYKMRYTLWVALLLGTCDVTKDGGFYSELELIKKRRKLTIFDARHVEYDINKHFASFCQHFVLLSPKKGKTRIFTPNCLDHL